MLKTKKIILLSFSVFFSSMLQANHFKQNIIEICSDPRVACFHKVNHAVRCEVGADCLRLKPVNLTACQGQVKCVGVGENSLCQRENCAEGFRINDALAQAKKLKTRCGGVNRLLNLSSCRKLVAAVEQLKSEVIT